MQTETRFFRADVRHEGATGRFSVKVFELTVPVTGSHHDLMLAAIRAIRVKGYETNRILSHSADRACL